MAPGQPQARHGGHAPTASGGSPHHRQLQGRVQCLGEEGQGHFECTQESQELKAIVLFKEHHVMMTINNYFTFNASKFSSSLRFL